MTTGEGELESYARARIGKMLRGKYRLDSLIGVGGMAVVYKATHRNQAEFAVKMLHPELSIREDVRTRFLREGYAANSVKHAGVVLVVDDDVTEDGGAFLVMELLDGVPCDSAWESSGRRMGIDAACVVAHQLLDVLAAAHAKGIIHRDIKPPNLFITREGRLKVLDFGIARVRDIAATNVTMSGMLLGTPAFMGPEQALAQSREIDAQTDVWAVGATMFTLISGALVHDGENAQQIMVKAATQKARSLADVAPEVAPAIVAVVDRALAFSKNDRWPTATAMRDALAEAFASSFGRQPSPSILAGIVDRAPPEGSAPRRSEVAPTADDPGGAASAPAISSGRMPQTIPMTVAATPALTEIASPSRPGSPDMKLVGVSTASPVVTREPPAAPAQRRRGAAVYYVAGAGGIVALSLGGLLWAKSHRETAGPNAPSSAVTAHASEGPAVASSPLGSGAAPEPAAAARGAATSVVHAPGGTVAMPAGGAPPRSTASVKRPPADPRCAEGSTWNGTACIANAPVIASAPPPPTAVLVAQPPPPPPPPPVDERPAARFTVNGDTIRDAQTGLTWQARTSGPVSFDGAQARCGAAGFRLPRESELSGLAAADGAMFGDLNSFCWSSSRRQGSTMASVVRPRGGARDAFANDPDVKNMIRCVR